MANQKRRGRAAVAGGKRIYELEVCIIGGPVTEAFAKANRVVSRTIQIRGDQMLSKLHEAIFDAFGRFDAHMYEFQVGGKRTMDPKARRYVLAEDAEFSKDVFNEQASAGLVTRTTIDALGLEKGQVFCYWFDFGDDWWHQINVLAIHDGPGRGKYPRVTAKVGKNPPQYPDWEDEDEDGEEDEE